MCFFVFLQLFVFVFLCCSHSFFLGGVARSVAVFLFGVFFWSLSLSISLPFSLCMFTHSIYIYVFFSRSLYLSLSLSLSISLFLSLCVCEKRILIAKKLLLKGFVSPFLDPQVFLGRPDSHSTPPTVWNRPYLRRIGVKKIPYKNGVVWAKFPPPDTPRQPPKITLPDPPPCRLNACWLAGAQ